jgi:hypothetical protein
MSEEISSLEKLAQSAGVISHFSDIEGNLHVTEDALTEAILSALGLGGAPETVLEQERLRKLRAILPPVIITGPRDLAFEFTLPEQAKLDSIQFQLVLDGGLGLGLRPSIQMLDQDWVDSIRYSRYSALIPDDFPPGEHTLKLVTSAGVLATSAVIVCPDRCYIHPEIDEGARWNGIWLQLYALRSARNWGVGELGDLSELARITGPAGIRVLGLSPLHTPFFWPTRHEKPVRSLEPAVQKSNVHQHLAACGIPGLPGGTGPCAIRRVSGVSFPDPPRDPNRLRVSLYLEAAVL